MSNELSFQDLRRLEVINGSDGKRMGHIIDLIFTSDGGKVKGIVLPYGKKNIFAKSQDLFLPWSCVQKIGEDIILVEIEDLCSGAPVCKPAPQKPDRLPPSRNCDDPPKERNRDGGGDCGGNGNCDGICEKCMLFDCSRRWENFAATS